jgi:hypothetical protein
VAEFSLPGKPWMIQIVVPHQDDDEGSLLDRPNHPLLVEAPILMVEKFVILWDHIDLAWKPALQSPLLNLGEVPFVIVGT